MRAYRSTARAIRLPVRYLGMVIVKTCLPGLLAGLFVLNAADTVPLVEIKPGSFDMGVDSVPLPAALLKGPNGVIFDRSSNQGDYDEVPVHKTAGFGHEAIDVGVLAAEAQQRPIFGNDQRGMATTGAAARIVPGLAVVLGREQHRIAALAIHGKITFWSNTGRKEWERAYADDGTWTWRIFDSSGRVTAESRWKGKNLLDANVNGRLP